MAFNFPNSPANGAIYAPVAGGPIYTWDAAGGVWKITSGGLNGGLFIGDNPPSNPINGQMWLRSTTGALYAWYVEPTSSQWIQIPGIATPNGDAGKIDWFAMRTPPPGWLKANGIGVLRATYPNLDTAIYCGDANNATAGFGYHCTDATAATRSLSGLYLALPEMRDEFARGWVDDRAGINAGRAFGSTQADALQNITGRFKQAPTSGGIDGQSGAFAANPGGQNYDSNVTLTTNPGVGYGDFDASRVARTAAETRPHNVALLACIKY